MEPLPNIPPPVTFNSFKHHKLTIKAVIAANVYNEEFAGNLPEAIGNNYTDIYTGILTPLQIAGEVTGWLTNFNLIDHAEFSSWVSCSRKFRALALSDGSLWILREGENPDRYIHIHPAKTGAYTVRFKATTLITFYAAKILFPEIEIHDLQTVNTARKQAGLPPMKSLVDKKGLMKCREEFK